MSKPFFSVIVPAHNSAEFIWKGLQSIRAQTFKDYELIVVCDNCTDNTQNIVSEYADKVIVTDHGHDGLARNAGIDAAAGEWILFMDDDDWWLHEYAFQQIADMVGQHGENVLAYSFIWKGRGYTAQSWDKHFPAVWSKCWKREFIGDTRFTDLAWACDAQFYRKLMRKQPIIYFWDMPMYYYNFMRPGSQTYNKFGPEVKS